MKKLQSPDLLPSTIVCLSTQRSKGPRWLVVSRVDTTRNMQERDVVPDAEIYLDIGVNDDLLLSAFFAKDSDLSDWSTPGWKATRNVRRPFSAEDGSATEWRCNLKMMWLIDDSRDLAKIKIYSPARYCYLMPFPCYTPKCLLFYYLPVAKRLRPLIFLPYLKNIYGNGSIATVKNASRLVAHWKPSFSYICIPNNGNAPVTWVSSVYKVDRPKGTNPNNNIARGEECHVPAKVLRAKLLAANALAAYNGYASTKNVKIPLKTSMFL